ncbi:hypothetical protein DdX_14337 [Ditylenchus destructor]|uniref:Uncharacterized protein n=1 Tax=Ditylenchus destructor TaxID=166010 RepID=A0AAD4MUG7_9BILA|nr:hypothetical protein DdX_14337 [Ditylenchus destructor]
MGSSHMSLFAMFVLVVPTFSRIHPSPIDDAIQPKISQGPDKQTPVQGPHHEHLDQSSLPDQTLDDTDRTSYSSSEDEVVEVRGGRRRSYEDDDDEVGYGIPLCIPDDWLILGRRPDCKAE